MSAPDDANDLRGLHFRRLMAAAADPVLLVAEPSLVGFVAAV